LKFFRYGVTAEALRSSIGSKSAISLQRGPVDPKFQVEVVAPPTILLLRKLGKLSFVWYKNLEITFFRFVTMHAFDGQTPFSSLVRAGIPCTVEKTAKV